MALYLLTGCSAGIGAALAREAVKRGHRVIGAARRLEKLQALKAELGDAFTPMALDVSDRAAVRRAMDALPELPDVVMMNAGLGDIDNAATFDLSIHDRTFATNYFGSLNVVDALFKRMQERGRGTFVVTSSLAGYRGMPDSAAYSASKAALTACFEAMRLTYSRWSGLQFLTIHPGFVETDMTAKNPYPMPFMWKADKAARFILDGVEQGRPHINFPFPMWAVTSLSRFLPPKVFLWILGRKAAPTK